MDFHKLNIEVTNATEALQAIRDFLVTDPDGPAWTEDGTYLLADHPGVLFMRTATDTAYIVFRVDGTTIHSCHLGTNAAAAGYGSGDGPDFSVSCGSYNNSAATQAVGLLVPEGDKAGPPAESVLYLAADSNRLIAGLSAPNGQNSVLFVGFYYPACDGADDDTPLIVASNIIDPGVDDSQTFPSAIAKVDATGRRRVLYRFDFNVNPSPSAPIPANDRSDTNTVFSMPMHVMVQAQGRGEILGLSGSSGTDGLLRCSSNLAPWQTITVGLNSYLVVPLDTNSDRVGSAARALIGPLGEEVA